MIAALIYALSFLGLNARTRIEAVVMTAKQAKEISQALSKDSASAIVQVRFQMRALEFYQGEETTVRSLISISKILRC